MDHDAPESDITATEHSRFVNWEENEDKDIFTGVRTVLKTLPPGIYDSFEDDYNRPCFRKLTRRKDKMFDLLKGKASEVIREVSHFWESYPRYKQLGVTHKRGILLHGEPGCGKTSIISKVIDVTIEGGGIASVINGNRELAYLVRTLPKLRHIQPDTPIVIVMEDFDDLCAGCGESQILEVLDGTTSMGDNVLFLASTNNLHRVPERIRKRPSRIDTLIYIGLPDEALRLEYITSLTSRFGKMEVGGVCNEAIAAATEGLSLAHLKEIVIGCEIHDKPVYVIVDQMMGEDKKEEETEEKKGEQPSLKDRIKSKHGEVMAARQRLLAEAGYPQEPAATIA